MAVLVADDDRTSRTLLAATLKKWGYQVEVAVDGTEAWDIITRVSPRVAILDWMMPGIDGVELCRRVRRDPAHALTYLILLTGRKSKDDLLAGLNAGADDYVTKPFDPDELRARLNVARRILEANTESERLLASISSVLIGLDADGRVTRWNSIAAETFGLDAAEAIGRPLSDCGVNWADPALVERIVGDPAHGAHHDDIAFRDARGQERLVNVTVAVMKHGEGSTGRVVLGSEVTQRRVLEAQFRQAQKLEGIGQLAAGIAHEINTPMQYIGDNVRYLGDSIAALDALFAALLGLGTAPADPAAACANLARLAEQADIEFLRKDLPSAVAQSLEGVEHVSRIVKAMKEFSHPGTGRKEPVDLNHVIETTVVVARNELKYVADVKLELDTALPRVPCLAGEIKQVLLNLFINAAHAIGDVVGEQGGRGTIIVSTHLVESAVEIRVADTGKGIPEAIRPRIFDPFFTTKDVGKGTGQGLSMAHATVVGRHGGQIWFESTLGAGTTFFIRLPLLPAEEQKAA